MSERATRTNWRQPITGHKSNSGGRKGRKQAEKPTLTEQGIDVDEFIRENHARIQRLRETTPRSGIPNEGVAFDPAEYARIISERVGKSKKTVRNNFATLRKEGILPPAENPFASQRKPKPEPAANKEEPMIQTTTPKITAGTIATTNPTPRDITTTEVVPEKHYENPRAIIANALVGIYDSISALQRAAYHANDKVVYGFATKLMNGELMDIKANYSKDTK